MRCKEIIIKLTLLFCLLLFQNVFSQSPYVPLNHWAYDYLERMETKHAIKGVLNHTKPLARKEFAGYLKQLSQNVDRRFELNKVEQEQLQFLLFEFQEELGTEEKQNLKYRSRIQKLKEHKTFNKYFPSILYKNNRNFFNWQEGKIKIFFDPVYRYKSSYTKPDSTNKQQKAFHFTNGFQIWGYLTEYFGFFVDVRDNKEWGDQKYPLGNYTLPRLGFVRATSEDYIYHDETEAYVKLGTDNFQVIYGKFKNYWGSTNTGSLILSDYATSYDQLKLEYRHRKFKFTSFYAFLIDYAFHIEDKLQGKKYMSGHRLEVAPWNWLTLGLSEAVMFMGRKFEPAYLNPVMFFRSAEHYLGSPDNMMMGFDFKFTALQDVKLYGELLIDDLTTTKLGTNWYGNKYGFLGGFLWVEPFNLSNLDIRFDYTRIRPYVYTHENRLQYTHYNSTMGHWIGPNSELYNLNVKYRLTRRQLFSATYLLIRHGDNSDTKNYGGNIDEFLDPDQDNSYPKFLGGIIEKNQGISFSSSYEVLRNLVLCMKATNNVFSRSHGKKINTTSMSFSIGINY